MTASFHTKQILYKANSYIIKLPTTLFGTTS
jgi:hypothetical protein